MNRSWLAIIICGLSGLFPGFGCHHIGGKHDCGYHPGDYAMPPLTNPYPSTPASSAVPPKVKTGVDTPAPDAAGPLATGQGY
ncbi:MAG: hypothetical protein NZ703_09170 [Gemmataceae bacterium]|nr:hypothetical protein [Gemmataceae bacterium]MCS7271244.1 hypothetical protein [Gemmataceae bacterium]MDW8241872.1 hypothetical protein [Thermogemmata sp.]